MRRRLLQAFCVPLAVLFSQAAIQARSESAEQPAPRPILFVLDASGSMNEMFGGVSRMSAARVMLEEQLARLDRRIPVGLAAYGNRLPGCGSQRLYNPIAIGNRERVNHQASSMVAAGATPIANTLRLIGTAIAPVHPGLLVVLLSDGAESCGGNPALEAASLRARGVDIRINVIGLAVDADTAVQLGDVARQGGGRYFHVRNHTEFEAAIRGSTEIDVPAIVSPPAAPAADPSAATTDWLEIVSVETLPGAASGERWRVHFRFQAPRRGDYHVSVQARLRAAPAGRDRRLLGESPLAIAGQTFYDSEKGEGSVIIEQPGDLRRGLVLQAELWLIDELPQSLYVSRAVAGAR